MQNADAAFTAGDSFVGGRLVVVAPLAEDRIPAQSQGKGPGEIGCDGSTVRFGGVAFGTATGGLGDGFTITFDSAVTGAAVDVLIQRLA